MLDAQTIDSYSRLSSFGEDSEAMLSDFFTWVEENALTHKDIWYADIFKMDEEGIEDPKRISTLQLRADGSVVIEPKDDGFSAFTVRPRPLKGFIKKIKKALNI